MTFAPATFRGDLATGVRNGNEAVRTSLFCRSEPLVVHVVPPPAEGRPSSFCGTVGTALAVSASLDAQSCRQGDPVRLTLDIAGVFSQRSFRVPQLAARPGFDGVFRVYADVKTESGPTPGSLRLTYTLRPLQAGTIELPPIDVAYYNTASNAYAVARTEPVPLRVDEVPAFDPEALFASLEAAAGESAGATEITLSGYAFQDGAPVGKLKYKSAASLAAPALGDDIGGWTDLALEDGKATLTVTGGHKLVVAAADGDGRCVAVSNPVTAA